MGGQNGNDPAEDILTEIDLMKRDMECDIEVFIDHINEMNNLEEDAAAMAGAAKGLKRQAKTQQRKMWFREQSMKIGLACVVGGLVVITVVYLGIFSFSGGDQPSP